MDINMLSKDDFNKLVLKRDDCKCVMCGSMDDLVVHHIIEKKLWIDGGYLMSNGVVLCPICRILADQTDISCEEIREAAEIKDVVVPQHFSIEDKLDRWGNIILPNGMRVKGEMFFDENVQKFLKSKLHLFTKYVKFPRIPHCPWSQSVSKDDFIIESMLELETTPIVISKKMDGENSSFYNDHYHARSVDSKNHPSRNFVKNLWASIKHDIPEGFRICGENLYAKHSIFYDNLPSYFLVFSVWNEKNVCLSWDETEEWAKLLGLQTVPVLFRGMLKNANLTNIFDPDKDEGYVMRVQGQISYGEFRKKICKNVRKSHVNLGESHWMRQIITKNLIKN